MNADDLRFFLAVRQAGSIKGGARILKVDHSTVSRRLVALEESLGASLFERTPEAEVAPVNVVKREADIAIRQRPQGTTPAEPEALATKVGKLGTR